MTFAELIILVAVGAALCFLMRPIQRRLESRFYKFFRSRSRHSGKSVIDITDYSKKGKKQ